MALEKKTIPYETLVRHNPDGTISGAHYVERVVILDDGIEVSSVVTDPMPIPLDSPVFKEAEATALNQAVELAAALEEKQTILAAKDAELDVTKSELASKEAELGALLEKEIPPDGPIGVIKG